MKQYWQRASRTALSGESNLQARRARPHYVYPGLAMGACQCCCDEGQAGGERAAIALMCRNQAGTVLFRAFGRPCDGFLRSAQISGRR